MPSTRVKFGDYELNGRTYELSRRGRPIKLERIPMELLMLLLERRGQLVTRSEIVEKLWGKDVFVDVDNSINTAVRKLRRVFRDNPRKPTFLLTVTGKGYRFVAPISEVTHPSSTSERRPMLAVLPFENLSNDLEQEYFSDGLTEETISRLGQINPEQLGVIARTSSMAYKRTAKSIAEVGRELGLDYILESSVRREGQRIRITSQLIRVNDQTHLWASTYDRDTGGFLGVQSELASAIADQVKISLLPQAGGRTEARTRDSGAYDLYLRGRYYWNQLTPPTIQRGIEYFKEAVAKDPGYALAYAGLADCYMMLPITCDAPALDILPKATAAAQRAVELDSRLAEGHTAAGSIKLWMEWDWTGAEAAFRRALALNSNYVTVHRYYGHLLSNLGRHAESAEEMRRAREVDPLSPIMHALSGRLQYQARQYDSALEHLKNALAINADFWVVHMFLGSVYERLQRFDQARTEYQKAFELSSGNTEAIASRGHILAQLGQRAEAEEAIRVLKELSKHRYVPPYNIAIVHNGLGDADAALGWLEKAYETRDVRLTFLAVEPKWDPMRGEPRFQALLKRLALPTDASPQSASSAHTRAQPAAQPR
jgi:TolB-like protein/Tfp pilus assembly protein PilF